MRSIRMCIGFRLQASSHKQFGVNLKSRISFAKHLVTSIRLTACTLWLAALFISTSTFSQTRDSLDIKIGQMILMGIPYAKVDTMVFEAVKSGQVGSIILFEKNIPKKPSAFTDLKKIVWTYQKASPTLLFVSIDQEGGRVNRLKEKYGFARSITADQTGKSKSLDSAKFYAESTAAILAGLGFNVNFAPCVDVAVDTANPVIYKKGRSYSANEDSIALLAKEFIKQHRRFGVNTVLKHFPGHGSSTTDSHFGVADVTNSWTERELKPYKILLDSGYVDGVMTCHIVNKNLDQSGKPGTLSYDILNGILRKKLGYNGVVFSDDMQMEAISKQYGFEESIKLAILAGVDILCFANNVPGSQKRKVELIFSVIKNAVNSGEISAQRINESYKRIVKLKNETQISAQNYYKDQHKQLVAAQNEIKILQAKLNPPSKKSLRQKKREERRNKNNK